MVLAPHPDDQEFGCGASVAKFVEGGAEVQTVVFSDCTKSLPDGLTAADLINEQLKAAAILGVEEGNVHFKDFQVRDFPESRQSILEEMVKLNRTYAPDLVLCPSSFDIHQDHQTISREAQRAFKASTILGYELPWNVTQSRLDTFVEISVEHLKLKTEAISCYNSQSFRKYSDPQLFVSLASIRGIQAGCTYAESFETIRHILK